MYCPYGLRCQFVHSVRDFTEKTDDNEETTFVPKKKYVYSQILEENAHQLMMRVKTSENPDISEFNTVMKDIPRLQVFQDISNLSEHKRAKYESNNSLQPEKKESKHNL